MKQWTERRQNSKDEMLSILNCCAMNTDGKARPTTVTRLQQLEPGQIKPKKERVEATAKRIKPNREEIGRVATFSLAPKDL